jgi:predicted nucleotidyltransferase
MHPVVSERLADLERLCAQFRVNRLALFGSARTLQFQSGRSDLDFLVEFEPMAPVDHAQAYFGLLEALERLFKVPVDLVEPGGIRNPFFKREAEATQLTVYAAA